MNFIWLLFAHYIGDIALQNKWQSENKGKFWYAMFSHCMVWTAVICFGLQFLGIFAFWKVLFLLFGHWAADYWKSRKTIRTPKDWKYLYIDQAWHIFQLLMVYLF